LVFQLVSDSQKKSWHKSIKVFNEPNQPVHKTLFALHDDDDVCENIDAIPLRLSEMKLEKLNLTLPPQSPPKIYSDQINN